MYILLLYVHSLLKAPIAQHFRPPFLSNSALLKKQNPVSKQDGKDVKVISECWVSHPTNKADVDAGAQIHAARGAYVVPYVIDRQRTFIRDSEGLYY